MKKFVIFLHTILIIMLYLSPFWIAWQLIAVLILLNYVQLYLFGGCVLTIQQFKSTKISFQEWLLGRAGIKVNRQKFNRYLRWQLPFIILALAIFWQVALGLKPILEF